MKKVLLGTSAIALATAAAVPASAAEWEVRVGGYMEQFVAYADSDVSGFTGDEFGGVDVKDDTEIHFLPSITLDNGLKIGADVQLEGSTGGDQIDESFLYISGSFGRVQLGSENSAGYAMHYSAPDVGAITNGHNSGGLNNFVPFSGTTTNFQGGANVTLAHGNDLFRATLYSVNIENGANNDAQRITYFTPRFAGFQLGVSYARDGNQDNNSQINQNNNALNDIIDIGANYVNSFGGVDLAVSGRWGMATDDRTNVAGTDIGEDPQVWGAGMNVGFAGVTVGGSFAEQNNSGTQDGRSFDAGISYETGPWGFSFSYLNGENVNNENQFDVLGNDEKSEIYVGTVRYALARGVNVYGFGSYIDFDEEQGDAGGPNVTSGDDIDGFVVGTGIKVSF